MSYHTQRLQYSGYPEDFRQRIVADTIRKVDNNTLGWHRNRMRTTSTVNRQQWYMDGGRYSSVLFAEATPGSELTRRFRKAIKKAGLKIKVVEKVGTTIKRLLQRSNPFGVSHCERADCTICEKGIGIDCRERGCVYEYECDLCGRKYCGQTGRSLYHRNNEHLAAWEMGDDECPLQRHSNIYHDGQDYSVNLKILAKCYGKPSKRMITEAVQIGEIPEGQTMNNRNEWNYANLMKVNLYR